MKRKISIRILFCSVQVFHSSWAKHELQLWIIFLVWHCPTLPASQLAGSNQSLPCGPCKNACKLCYSLLLNRSDWKNQHEKAEGHFYLQGDKSLKLSVKSFSTTNLAEYYFRGLKLLPKSHSLDYSHVQSMFKGL